MTRRKRADSRSLGLEFSLELVRVLTGEENLHYGLWTGLDVTAGNLGPAQRAYTETLFRLLPERQTDGRPLRILDIGGGAGVPAARLLALGHVVDVIVPAGPMPDRVRANAPAARVFATTFEEFTVPADRADGYDVCLFAESFQYIPFEIGLPKALRLLRPDGVMIVADCFRTEAYFEQRALDKDRAHVGGGHRLTAVRAYLSQMPLTLETEIDVTQAAAPSVDVQQSIQRLIGVGLRSLDKGFAASRPLLHGLIAGIGRMLLSPRRRKRLQARLFGDERNSAAFEVYNRYLLWRFTRCPAPQ